METALIIISAVSLLLLIYILMLKNEIRKITAELIRSRDKSYNRKVTVNHFDRDINRLAAELNKDQEYQQLLKKETERAEEHMKQSAADIAHDLRTPLTVIIGDLQLLQREKGLSDKGMEYTRICMDKAGSLKKMADDFFELSILEGDRTTVATEHINAVNTVMEFIAAHESIIREHNMEPDILLPEKAVHIFADKAMLDRMLANLLNNVLKYANDSFCISVSEQDDSCCITFSNHTDDITQENVYHLFERTYRSDRARSGAGAGLGLYIVRLLAEKQGAKAVAEYKDGILSMSIIFRK